MNECTDISGAGGRGRLRSTAPFVALVGEPAPGNCDVNTDDVTCGGVGTRCETRCLRQRTRQPRSTP